MADFKRRRGFSGLAKQYACRNYMMVIRDGRIVEVLQRDEEGSDFSLFDFMSVDESELDRLKNNIAGLLQDREQLGRIQNGEDTLQYDARTGAVSIRITLKGFQEWAKRSGLGEQWAQEMHTETTARWAREDYLQSHNRLQILVDKINPFAKVPPPVAQMGVAPKPMRTVALAQLATLTPR